MRACLPDAIELVYDNYYALVIGFSPTERPSDARFSIVVYPDHVSLCFLRGATLPDPQRLLKGNGKVVRHIRVDAAGILGEPSVQMLMDLATEGWNEMSTPAPGSRVVIRAIAKRQHPRRRS
ncbi:MAG: hypothetical protein JO024_04045 [Candidatus Eremiobacteraeota bacterium]|nr:hypothetical protein [Candidatus Eremiobacteraeota bacterium]MBV9736654.1 hypothetical protein [Candidatus Eremiobacteraeota bacterium]